MLVPRSGHALNPRLPPNLLARAAILIAAGCGAAPLEDPPPPLVPPPPVHGAPVALPALVAAAAPAGPQAPAVAYRCEGIAIAAGGRSYCVYRIEATWQEAEQRCLATGAHLAAVGSAAENEALRGALGSPLGTAGSLWIGLTERAEDRWVLVDGEIPHFGNWAQGEPNNAGGNEGCAEWYTADGRWNDADCNAPRGYVCEGGMAAQGARGKAPRADSGMSCTGLHFIIGQSEYCAYKDAARTWASAQKACQAAGGTLAIISTSAENQALYEALGLRLGAPQAWIGFTDRGHEGTWTWTSDEPSTFQAFRPGEPNNAGGEDCAEWYAADGGWNDLSCNVARWSVCEAPSDPPAAAAVARPP